MNLAGAFVLKEHKVHIDLTRNVTPRLPLTLLSMPPAGDQTSPSGDRFSLLQCLRQTVGRIVIFIPADPDLLNSKRNADRS